MIHIRPLLRLAAAAIPDDRQEAFEIANFNPQKNFKSIVCARRGSISFKASAASLPQRVETGSSH
jgi:hypothetical protein